MLWFENILISVEGLNGVTSYKLPVSDKILPNKTNWNIQMRLHENKEHCGTIQQRHAQERWWSWYQEHIY